MNDTEINDIRTIKEFKSISFSNFKKTDVFKELNNSCLSKIKKDLYQKINIYIDLLQYDVEFN